MKAFLVEGKYGSARAAWKAYHGAMRWWLKGRRKSGPNMPTSRVMTRQRRAASQELYRRGFSSVPRPQALSHEPLDAAGMIRRSRGSEVKANWVGDTYKSLMARSRNLTRIVKKGRTDPLTASVAWFGRDAIRRFVDKPKGRVFPKDLKHMARFVRDRYLTKHSSPRTTPLKIAQAIWVLRRRKWQGK